MSNLCIGSENNLSHKMIEKYIQMEETIEILLKVKKVSNHRDKKIMGTVASNYDNRLW